MSLRRGVIVLGSGKRIQDAALPALMRLEDRYEVRAVFARKAKAIEVEGRSIEVRALDSLRAGELRPGELVVCAVKKSAVPDVVRAVARMAPGALDLLIDTPVLLFKHLGHLRRLQAFRKVWVAEDTITLPAFDPVRNAIASGAIGELTNAVFQQSAWAYHGFAMAKAVLGLSLVASARRRAIEPPYAWRTGKLANGRRFQVLEPRDYPIGRMLFTGTRGSIADYPQREDDQLLLETIVRDGRVHGFRVGDHATELDDAERSLMDPVADAAEGRCGIGGVTATMESQKRVGFLRLLRRIDAGEGAYPLEQAIDDSVVDWHLDRFGRYVSNPLTSPQFATARLALRALTKFGG